MRLPALILLATLIATPAWAQTTGAGNNNFGRVFCSQHFACENSGVDLPALANSCIGLYFGMHNPEGFFDRSAEIDSSGCLTTRADALVPVNGVTLAPQCCVIPSGNGNDCIMRCEQNKL